MVPNVNNIVICLNMYANVLKALMVLIAKIKKVMGKYKLILILLCLFYFFK